MVPLGRCGEKSIWCDYQNVAGAVSKIVPADQIKETVDKAVEEKLKELVTS